MYIEGIVENLAMPPEDGPGSLRVSAVGTCIRKQWYDLNSYEREALRGRSGAVFAFGDATEKLVLDWLAESGVEVVNQQMEIEIEIPEDIGPNVLGHIDGIIREDAFDWDKAGETWGKDGEPEIVDTFKLLEIKSMNHFSFQRLGDEFPTDDSYYWQIQGYLKGTSLDECVLIIVNKNTCHMKEYLIRADEKIQDKIVARCVVLYSCSTPPSREFLPEMDKKGNWKLKFPCTYCGHVKHCHPGVEVNVAGRSPVMTVPDWREA
jgi:hypothetical protein